MSEKQFKPKTKHKFKDGQELYGYIVASDRFIKGKVVNRETEAEGQDPIKDPIYKLLTGEATKFNLPESALGTSFKKMVGIKIEKVAEELGEKYLKQGEKFGNIQDLKFKKEEEPDEEPEVDETDDTEDEDNESDPDENADEDTGDNDPESDEDSDEK